MAADPGKILPVDVYPVGDSTTTYEVIEGITKAINPGAAALDSSATTQNPGAATPTSANTPGANIINLSLGGTGDSALLQSLIEEGTQKGVLFVAASGNDGGTAPTYPAAYPGVLRSQRPIGLLRRRRLLRAGHGPRHLHCLSQRPAVGSARHLHRHRFRHRLHRPDHQ